MAIVTPDDLFLHDLRPLARAERQSTSPKAERGPSVPKRKATLPGRGDPGEAHFERLERVFTLLNTRARGDAVFGPIDQAAGLVGQIDHDGSPNTRGREAVLVTLVRLIAKYESAHKLALVALARQMANPLAGAPLKSTQAGADVRTARHPVI